MLIEEFMIMLLIFMICSDSYFKISMPSLIYLVELCVVSPYSTAL